MAQDTGALQTTHEIALEAYGVRAVISTNSREVLDLLMPVLPPGWTRGEPTEGDQRFRVITGDGAFFDVEVEGDETTAACNIDVAVGVLDARLRAHIALNAPDRIFVHAGVVAHRGLAIVVPGPSFSGKTTLVAELVRAGAAYYSDEYAVLDDEGLVHPYARLLSVRSQDLATQSEHHVSTFGGAAGERPVRIGLVVVAPFAPGASWQPRTLTRGEGVLSLLANTIPGHTRPEQALRAVGRALEGAIVLEGDRGDAAQIAGQILDSLPK